MTETEAQKIIDAAYPDTVDGQVRPTDKLDVSIRLCHRLCPVTMQDRISSM